MNKFISRIPNDVQDRNSLAWKKLCNYIEDFAASGRDEFSPAEALGPELFAQIYTLPESIATLKHVKKVWLYGSKLKRIPPEIGEMTALEYFDPYTSYDLHWCPYELVQCKNLKDSRVSIRALYGNYKNRMGFPNLQRNPVRYMGNTVHCSICKKEMTYAETNQLWISLRVGTDTLPLLANLCSKQCEGMLPHPPLDYIPTAHKGGANLQQPPDDEWTGSDEELEMDPGSLDPTTTDPTLEDTDSSKKSINSFHLIKLVRKIWDR